MPRSKTLFLIAGFSLLSACSSSDENLINDACMASFSSDEKFCSCLGETIVDTLDGDELDAYTEAVGNALASYEEHGGARIRLFPVPKLYRFSEDRKTLSGAIKKLYKAEDICLRQ
ncbi:hypothetical protein [uncultured Pseudoteredinibacter sp.]|uniref:hypothetical protein n=1 Tax=uncultured Pseudoteredinibacter sp. TaxID=1641701 RepID=UPI002636779A|nr:hypothetical protein [uncultured Pseudoteredinibacter sp.]